MKYSEYELNIIKKYYGFGGVNKVQEYINRSRDSIRHTAKKLGIKTTCRENQCDISDFLNIQTEKIAYLLGFIWGDGCIQQTPRRNYVNVTINMEDAEVLSPIFDSRWRKFIKIRQRPEWKDQTTFILNHKQLIKFLVENDFKEKSVKSPCKILNKIPTELHYHFFRGWFDADGHFGGCLTVSGTKNQDWTALLNLSDKMKLKSDVKTGKTKTGEFSFFQIIGSRDQIKFLYFIYQKHQYSLFRKESKYIDYLKFLYQRIKDRELNLRGISSYTSKRNKKTIYTVNIGNQNPNSRGTSIIGKTESLQEAKNLYDRVKYNQYKDIFLLHNPENYQDDPNFYLYLESKRFSEI